MESLAGLLIFVLTSLGEVAGWRVGYQIKGWETYISTQNCTRGNKVVRQICEGEILAWYLLDSVCLEKQGTT